MHQHRRKSGHASHHLSMTDVHRATTASKPARPALMARKGTSQSVHKLGKNPRDREKELEDERFFEEERESFPQFCTTCEKQFVPQDERDLYCSKECREMDGKGTQTYSPGQYSFRQSNPVQMAPPPRHLVPPASPSRPTSFHLMPVGTPDADAHSQAVSALRSLSIQAATSPLSPAGNRLNVNSLSQSAATSPSSSCTQKVPSANGIAWTYDAAHYLGGSRNEYQTLAHHADPYYNHNASVRGVDASKEIV